MESIEEIINKFLSVSYGYGDGDGDGYGDGSGYGHGSGYGSGDGYGDGDGDGYGDGSGSGYGDGYGDGDGDGYGDGSGYGYGDGDGIKEYGRQKVYLVDGVQTIIQSIHRNIARGAIVHKDMTLEDCFIAKVGDSFAHGNTIHESVADAQRKHLNKMPEEERIAAFIEKNPSLDTLVPTNDLYEWHNILTGSCKLGRDIFCHEHEINMDGNYTVSDFIEMTKDAYGGEIISQLEEVYEKENQ